MEEGSFFSKKVTPLENPNERFWKKIGGKIFAGFLGGVLKTLFGKILGKIV